MAIDDDRPKAGGSGEDDLLLHRRGFFSQSLRNIFRPLADMVEQRMQNLDPAIWGDSGDDVPPSPYPVRSDYAPPPPPKYVRPPGALPEGEFLSRCSSSGRCVQACPVSAIRLVWSSEGRLSGKPAIDADVQACVLCDDLSCMKACPSGALRSVPRGEIRMGLAVLRRERCLRTSGEDCRLCVDKCPVGSRAIDVPYPGADVTVKADACTGCGVCQMACPAQPRAIIVEPPEP